MVTQRYREIAIRMAIGASAGQVLKLILAKGIALTVSGAAVGLVAGFGLSRLLSTLVFGIATTDVVTFASGVLVLGIAAVSACYIPARRAVRVDPACALKAE
jgi:putative ABC transport system permease protein